MPIVNEMKLCRIVEGVEFSFDEQGVPIRALILRDALEEFFGADHTPDSWLRAYCVHQDTIHCAAADRFRQELSPPLVVLRADRPEDFGFEVDASPGDGESPAIERARQRRRARRTGSEVSLLESQVLGSIA
jgi:hypothetical protein